MAEILDGRAAAAALKERLASRVGVLHAKGTTPSLTLIRVGEDPASAVYVRAKEKACRALKIRSEIIHLEAQTEQVRLLNEIERLNGESAVHGILLQLPLPEHLSEDTLLATIDPSKDVDGFHPVNVGRLCLGLPGFVAATPLGILRLLQHYQIEISGRRVVILGRSRTVGRPLANLLSARTAQGDATVTMCHSRTRDLDRVTREAEVLIVAIGQPRFVTAEMVSPGTCVIDVGIHREADPQRPGKHRLCGDVDFSAVEARVKAISPVPGGVGPMTVACVLENTVRAAEVAAGRATQHATETPDRRR